MVRVLGFNFGKTKQMITKPQKKFFIFQMILDAMINFIGWNDKIHNIKNALNSSEDNDASSSQWASIINPFNHCHLK